MLVYLWNDFKTLFLWLFLFLVKSSFIFHYLSHPFSLLITSFLPYYSFTRIQQSFVMEAMLDQIIQ